MACGCREKKAAAKRVVVANDAAAPQSQDQLAARPSRWGGKRVIERKGAANGK